MSNLAAFFGPQVIVKHNALIFGITASGEDWLAEWRPNGDDSDIELTTFMLVA